MRGLALLIAAAAHGRSLPATFEPLAPERKLRLLDEYNALLDKVVHGGGVR